MSARDVDEHQDSQDFFGRVRDRRQGSDERTARPGDAGEPFVMREVRRDRFADEEPLPSTSGLEKAPSGCPKYKKPQRAAAFNQ